MKWRQRLNEDKTVKFWTTCLSLSVLSAVVFFGAVEMERKSLTSSAILSNVSQGEVLGAASVQLPDSSKDFSTAYTRKSCTDTVPVGGDLQSYLDAVQPGDVLCLTAGATYTGQFTVKKRNTSANSWIVITTTREAELPEGRRVGPQDAPKMAKLVQPQNGSLGKGGLMLEEGASYYRLIGLEITFDPSLNDVAVLARMGNTADPKNVSDLPHDIIFDRIYAHGYPDKNLHIGITIKAHRSALINSYITEVHEPHDPQHPTGGDGPGVYVVNNPGPIKIENNFIGAAGINFFIGGDGQSLGAQSVPENVWFRGNHVKKELTWKSRYDSKNLFEFKYGRQILIEGNVFENFWGGVTNQGYAMVLKTSNQGGGQDNGRYAQTADITVRHNKFIDISGGIMAGRTSLSGSVFNDGCCMNFHDNLFTGFGIQPKYSITSGNQTVLGFTLPATFPDGTREAMRDVTFSHNTVAPPAQNSMYIRIYRSSGELGKVRDFTFTNNIVAHKLQIDNTTFNDTGIQEAFPDSDFAKNFQKNLVVGSQNLQSYSGANYSAPSYSNLLAADYRLNNPGSYPGTDGRPVGADIAKLNSCIAGVVAGTWNGCAGGGGGGTGDTISPSVSFTSPTNGSTVSGTVSMSVNASDNVGVGKVEFYIDDVYKSVDSSSPYNYSWDTINISNGSHAITAKAYDTSGNVGQANININVGNGDPVIVKCVNPSPLAVGYAAPCPVLELSAYNVSGGVSLTIKATPPIGSTYFYIYRTIYVSEQNNACPGGASKVGGVWCPLQMTGASLPDDSNYLTSGSYTLSQSQLSQLSNGIHYITSWDWAWDGSCYVGAGSGVCDTGKWRYQVFTK